MLLGYFLSAKRYGQLAALLLVGFFGSCCLFIVANSGSRQATDEEIRRAYRAQAAP